VFSSIPVLKDLIESCWKSAPDKRPTFKILYAEKKWEEAKTQAASKTDKSLSPILELFKNQKTIYFGTVVKKFGEAIHESDKLFIKDEINGPFDNPYVRTLIQAFGIGKGGEMVSYDSTVRLINWIKDVRKGDILGVLYSVFCQDYFYGILSDDATNNVLSQSGKPGTYLVRFSPNTGQFMLNYFKKEAGGSLFDLKKNVTAVNRQPDTTVLQCQQLDALHNEVKSVINQLGIDINDTCGNRPAALVGLKIKEKYIVAGSNNYQTDEKGAKKNPGLDIGVGGATQSHYDFIL